MATRKQNVLARLRAIARARTEQEYMEKVSSLKESDEWKSSSNFRNYITRTWLPQQGNEDKNSNMSTARLELFSKKMLLIFFSIFFMILTEMGMGFPKRPFPHNNKYQQRYGETEQSL